MASIIKLTSYMHLSRNLEARVLVSNSSMGGALTLDEAFAILYVNLIRIFPLATSDILTFHKLCGLPVSRSNGETHVMQLESTNEENHG